MVKPKMDKVFWKTESQLIFKDYQFLFSLETNLESPRVRLNNEFSIPLLNNENIPVKWNGKTYPTQTGWQQLTVQSTDSLSGLNFYVMDSLQWKTWQSQQAIDVNKRFSAQNASIKNSQQKVLKPLKLIYFYLLALFCLGFLWLMPKLSD